MGSLEKCLEKELMRIFLKFITTPSNPKFVAVPGEIFFKNSWSLKNTIKTGT